MRINFKDNDERNAAVNILKQLASHYNAESLKYAELELWESRERAAGNGNFLSFVADAVYNRTDDFTGEECARCAELLSDIPEGFCKNKMDEAIIDSIKRKFVNAMEKQSAEEIEKKNHELINIPMTRGAAKALNDILNVLYDYILHDEAYGKLNDYEMEMRDKINKIIVKYDLLKEGMDTYNMNEAYRKRVGKYFVCDISDNFTQAIYNK